MVGTHGVTQLTNNISVIYNRSSYEAFVNKKPKAFKKYQAQLLDQLVNLIQTENKFVHTKATLCELLNTTNKNLHRKLSVCGDLIEIRSSLDSKDIPRGYVEVSISPAYGYVGTLEGRTKAILKWYGERSDKLNELKDVYVKQSLLTHVSIQESF